METLMNKFNELLKKHENRHFMTSVHIISKCHLVKGGYFFREESIFRNEHWFTHDGYPLSHSEYIKHYKETHKADEYGECLHEFFHVITTRK